MLDSMAESKLIFPAQAVMEDRADLRLSSAWSVSNVAYALYNTTPSCSSDVVKGLVDRLNIALNLGYV